MAGKINFFLIKNKLNLFQIFFLFLLISGVSRENILHISDEIVIARLSHTI